MGLILLRKQPQKLAVVRQYLVAILASLPFAVTGAAVAWPSPTLPKILGGETRLSLDATETSWMVSLLYLGEAVGTLPSVYLSDKIGRKRTLLCSGLFPIISWSMILTSESVWCLYVSRFLAGLQMGVITIVYPLYIREVCQTDIHGPLTAFSQITFNAGIFFVSVVGPFVPYHVLVSILAFLSGLFPIGFMFAAESPHYSLTRDDITSARDSLLWLRGDLNRIELEFELDRIENGVKTQSQKEGFIREIFTSNILRKYLVVVLILSALDGLHGVNVIQAFATVTLPKTAFGILTPNDCMIILSSGLFVTSFLATHVSVMGQGKTICAVFFCGCSVSMGAVAVWFFLNWKTEINVAYLDIVPFLGCLVHLILCNFCHSTSFGLINNQDCPSNSKSIVNILSTMTRASISFVLNKIYLQVTQCEGIYVNFVIYFIGCLLAAMFSASSWGSVVSDRTLQEEQDDVAEAEFSKSSITTVSAAF